MFRSPFSIPTEPICLTARPDDLSRRFGCWFDPRQFGGFPLPGLGDGFASGCFSCFNNGRLGCSGHRWPVEATAVLALAFVGLVEATAVLALAFGLVEATGRAASDLTAMRDAAGFITGV